MDMYGRAMLAAADGLGEHGLPYPDNVSAIMDTLFPPLGESEAPDDMNWGDEASRILPDDMQNFVGLTRDEYWRKANSLGMYSWKYADVSEYMFKVFMFSEEGIEATEAAEMMANRNFDDEATDDMRAAAWEAAVDHLHQAIVEYYTPWFRAYSFEEDADVDDLMKAKECRERWRVLSGERLG